MTSGIGGGLDDAIAAKLSLDLPANSEEILKSVSRYTYEIKTNMEATARATMDYTTYLESFPALQRAATDAQERQLGILRDTLSVIEKIKSAGPVYTNTIAGASPEPQNIYNTRTSDSGRIIPVAQNQNQNPFSDQQAYNRSRSNMAPLPGTIYDHNGNPISSFNPHNPAANNPASNNQGSTGGGSRGPAPAPNWPAVSDQDIMRQAERDAEIDRQRRIRERAAERRAAVDPLGGGGYPDSNGRMYDSRGNLIRNSDGTPRLLGNRRGGTPDPDGDANTPNGPPDQGGGGSRGGGGGGSGDGGSADGGNPGGGWNRFANTINDNFGLGVGALSPNVPIAARLAMASRLARQVADSGALGGASGLLGTVGKVGGGLALAGAGFNAVQSVGESIQGFRNMDVQDHTLAGGMGIQKDIMMMSLNPLLSSEQSREIIMGALKSGYSEGKTYETATEFIKDNLVDMNISVADSVKLLKTNVEGGRSSIESLKLSLETVTDASKNGPQTTAEAATNLEQLTAQLVSLGVVNGSAETSAQGLSQMFNTYDEKGTPNFLKENAVQFSSELLGNKDFNARLGLEMFNGTVAPSEIQARLSENGMTQFALDSTIQKIAKENVAAFGEDSPMAYEGFKSTMQNYGLTFDDGQMKSLFGQYKAVRTPGEIAAASVEDAKTPKINGQNAGAGPTFEEFKAMPGNENKTKNDWEKEAFGTPEGQNADITGKHLADFAKGHPDAVAIDPDGKAHLIDPEDSVQIAGLTKGTWKIGKSSKLGEDVYRTRDGYLVNGGGNGNKTSGILSAGREGEIEDLNKTVKDRLEGEVFDTTKSYTMQQFEAAGGDPEKYGQSAEDGTIDYKGSNEKGGGGRFGLSVDAGGNPTTTGSGMEIGLSKEAQRLFQLSPLNPANINNTGNTENSNSGFGGAQRNDPEPGNKVGPWNVTSGGTG